MTELGADRSQPIERRLGALPHDHRVGRARWGAGREVEHGERKAHRQRLVTQRQPHIGLVHADGARRTGCERARDAGPGRFLHAGLLGERPRQCRPAQQRTDRRGAPPPRVIDRALNEQDPTGDRDDEVARHPEGATGEQRCDGDQREWDNGHRDHEACGA